MCICTPPSLYDMNIASNEALGAPQVRAQTKLIPPPPTPHGAQLPHTALPRLLAWHLPPCSNPAFSRVSQRWPRHRRSSANSNNISSLHKRGRVYCTDSATWGSVPRGARKWIQKKTKTRRWSRTAWASAYQYIARHKTPPRTAFVPPSYPPTLNS